MKEYQLVDINEEGIGMITNRTNILFGAFENKMIYDTNFINGMYA